MFRRIAALSFVALALVATPAVAAEATPQEIERELSLTFDDRRLIQRGLNALGHEAGTDDGIFGRGTRAALRRYQLAAEEEATGYLTAEQAKTLLSEAYKSPKEEQVAVADYERPPDRRPGSTFKDCLECPEMVVVPAGSFMMGSPWSEAGRDEDEGPQHLVRIGKPLAVGRFEVTRDQFDAFVRASGHSAGSSCWTFENEKWKNRSGLSYANPGFSQSGDHPAVCVSWNDAKAYAAWLGKKTGRRYRLLSEAEWEYVARAGTTTVYYWGKNSDAVCPYANGADLTAKDTYLYWIIVDCRDGYVNTAPAGSFAPNDFGLYDTIGNAVEWAEDCWNGSYKGAPRDGSAWTEGECSRRVLRGGSWSYGTRDLRSANRGWDVAGGRDYNIGFRVARTLDR